MTAPPLPRRLQIEVTGACNLRCRMCLVRYRPPLNRVSASVPFPSFKALVDSLPELQEVALQGLGEPLLAPDLVQMVEYAAARGIRTEFNTNATLLSHHMAERLLAAQLDSLCISVDGATAPTYESIRDGARFETVRRNVTGLVELMRQRRAARPELSIVFVAMRRNIAELPALVRLTAEWGVPRVSVQNLSHSFSDTPPDSEYREIRAFTAAEALWETGHEFAAAFGEAQRVARNLGVALRLPELEPAPPRPPGTPGCRWPWDGAYVRHDGRVQPCCMLMGSDRGILGDLGEDAFAAIWSGTRYETFRAALLTETPPDVCRGCSMYRGVF